MRRIMTEIKTRKNKLVFYFRKLKIKFKKNEAEKQLHFLIQNRIL